MEWGTQVAKSISASKSHVKCSYDGDEERAVSWVRARCWDVIQWGGHQEAEDLDTTYDISSKENKEYQEFLGNTVKEIVQYN